MVPLPARCRGESPSLAGPGCAHASSPLYASLLGTHGVGVGLLLGRWRGRIGHHARLHGLGRRAPFPLDLGPLVQARGLLGDGAACAAKLSDERLRVALLQNLWTAKLEDRAVAEEGEAATDAVLLRERLALVVGLGAVLQVGQVRS